MNSYENVYKIIREFIEAQNINDIDAFINNINKALEANIKGYDENQYLKSILDFSNISPKTTDQYEKFFYENNIDKLKVLIGLFEDYAKILNKHASTHDLSTISSIINFLKKIQENIPPESLKRLAAAKLLELPTNPTNSSNNNKINLP